MTNYIAINYASCTGCKVCEMVCSLVKEGESNPAKARVQVYRKEQNGLVTAIPVVCQRCEEPACQAACPTEAIVDYQVIEDRCTGCSECYQACPIGAIRVIPERSKAVLCDLCQLNPPCISLCHSGCLSLASMEKPGKGGGYKPILESLHTEGMLSAIRPEGG